MIDYCTAFPEHWVRWKKFEDWRLLKFWELWEVIYIGGCCKIHDDTWKARPFLSCLRRERVVGKCLITAGGTLGVWFHKYVRNKKRGEA